MSDTSNQVVSGAHRTAPTADPAKLASFPLEDGAYENAPDSTVLWGFCDWKLTVGDVRASLRAAASPSVNLASFPLEDGAYESAPDNKVLWGFGDWMLTIGDVRAARRLVACRVRELALQHDDTERASRGSPAP